MYVNPTDIKFDQKTIDRFNAVMSAFMQETNKDMADILKESAIKLSEKLMEETPPYVNQLGSNKLDAKKVGEKAIRQDLLKSVTPVDLIFKDPIKDKRIKEAIKKDDVEKLNEMVSHMKGKISKWRFKTFEPALHTLGNRKQKYIGTTQKKRWNDYLKLLQSRVGYMKAGWAVTLKALGGSVPQWISRCMAYTKGGYRFDLDGEKKSIEFWNGTPTIKKFEGRYNNAVLRMSENLLKRIKIGMEYRAKKFGKQ